MAKKDGVFHMWLQRVRRTGEFSDVQVDVNGEEFHLHMLPLLNASAYFRNLPGSSNCSSHSRDKGYRVVAIPDLPGGVEGFSASADFCYLIKPSYTVQNIAQIRASAEFLGMADVVESTKKFLYTNVFAHWRASVAFLHQYQRLSSPVDEYVETRCLKVVVAALARAFGETKYLSAPMPLTAVTAGNWQSSPCQALTEILVRTASLPDVYASESIDALVDADVNLNIKCRQGRNVRSWLDSVIENDCPTGRARCWVTLCLSRMLLKGAPECRPWMELSSQYWCSLLEHVDHLEAVGDEDMQGRLRDVKNVLEQKIGVSLDELDDYLHVYKFGPETLMSMVRYYMDEGDPNPQSFEEIAGEVDGFLWTFAETGSIDPDTFISLVKAFPCSSRQSHDTIYGAIEKLLTKRTFATTDDKVRLWRLVDPAKLSPAETEKALNNPGFLSQPHILKIVLQQHNEELAKVADSDGQNLRHIMQKVINASLKLLEENSRRSEEIVELQQQYSALLGGKICHSQDSCDNSPDPYWTSNHQIVHKSYMRESETDQGSEISETPSIATVSSIASCAVDEEDRNARGYLKIRSPPAVHELS